MRKQFVAAVLAAVGWMLLDPLGVQAQTSLVNTSISISSYNAPNPRGPTFFNTNIPLQLQAGNQYTIKTAVATQPAYGIDTYIFLLDPSGATLGQNDDNGLGLGNPYGSYLQYTPAAAGTYTLVVSTYSPGVSYSGVPVEVTYAAVQPPSPPIALTVPANTTTSVSAYMAPNPRGTNFYNQNFTVPLVAGQQYTFKTAVATQPAYGIDTYIFLLNPSGATVGQDDDNSLGLGNPYGSYLQVTASTTGTYTLVVTTYSSGVSYTGIPLTIDGPPTHAPTPIGGGGGIPNVRLTPAPGKVPDLLPDLARSRTVARDNFLVAAEVPRDRRWIS